MGFRCRYCKPYRRFAISEAIIIIMTRAIEMLTPILIAKNIAITRTVEIHSPLTISKNVNIGRTLSIT